jgi:hypothetical protein
MRASERSNSLWRWRAIHAYATSRAGAGIGQTTHASHHGRQLDGYRTTSRCQRGWRRNGDVDCRPQLDDMHA